MIRVAVAVVVLALLWAAPAWAACGGSSPNWTAASASRNDIQACIDGATAGDTITVNAESVTYSGNVQVVFPTTKHVTLIASGTVSITDNTTAGEDGLDLFKIQEATTGSHRLEGFRFVRGTGLHFGASAIVSMIFTSGGKPILVTGNTFVMGGQNTNAMRATTNRGVVWGNTYTAILTGGPGTCANTSAALRHKPSGLTSSWSSVLTRGNADTNGDQMLYFEGNTMTNLNEALDLDDNARTVARFNTYRNSAITIHGDTSYPGGRYLEAYKNWFDMDTSYTCTGPVTPNLNGWIAWRAGTGLVWNNILDNQDSGWGTKTELVLRVDALQRNGGPYACWSLGYPAYPGQTGWGWIDQTPHDFTLSTGDHSGDAFDRQPIVIGGNTGTFTTGVLNYGGSACGSSPASATTFIQANREYYAQTASFTGASGTGSGTRAARPSTCTAGVYYVATDQGSWNDSGSGSPGSSTVHGVIDYCSATDTWTDAWYTPFVYPHPLASADTASASTSTVVADSNLIPADGTTTVTITVTVRTSAGDTIAGHTVTLAQGAGSSTITTVNGTTDSNGTATFTVKSSTVEIVTYTATNTTAGAAITQTAQVQFGAVAANPIRSKGFGGGVRFR